jgi:DNA-binding MarR family transcriptional regulator
MPRVRADVARAADDLEMLLGRLRRRIRAEAPNNGLPLSQMAVLGRVVRDGPDTATGLAAAERVRAQSIALTIGHLESQGLVERASDPADRRRILVSATEDGRRLIHTVRRSRQAWLAQAIAACFAEDEQETLVKAIALLDRLADCDPRTAGRGNQA